MFKYSKIVQDALGHHSFPDSTSTLRPQKEGKGSATPDYDGHWSELRGDRFSEVRNTLVL